MKGWSNWKRKEWCWVYFVQNEIIKTIEKTEAFSMSERENLTTVKTKKSQEKYLNFANLVIQEVCDDIELDMLLIQCCMLV